MTQPLCIDLCCGIGGWAEGFMAAGYRVIGFDIRTFKKYPYPGNLILQDIRTLDGQQFRNAACIVASPPCEEFSRKALPWHRDKPEPLAGIVLFDTVRRIIAGAGVLGVIENVRNAQRWMGKAGTHFGSFYLWGDIPMLRPHMPFIKGAFCGRTSRANYVRASHLRAKIPFDLAYWLATEWRRTGVVA